MTPVWSKKSDIRKLSIFGEVGRLSVLLKFHDPSVVEKVQSSVVVIIWRSWPSVSFVETDRRFDRPGWSKKSDLCRLLSIFGEVGRVSFF